MKNKKTDFEARFWSGARKHSAVGLLETFFQFNSLAEVKETLSMMVQCSVQKNVRITKDSAEVFHLYQSLRSLVRAGRLIGGKAKKGRFKVPSESGSPKAIMGSLSTEEYSNPAKVFRHAFKTCTLQEYDDFLSTVAYFSLADVRYEEEGSIIIPHLRLVKILDAAWLIAERASTEK